MSKLLEYSGASMFRLSVQDARRGNLDPALRFPEVARHVRKLGDLRVQRRAAWQSLSKLNHDQAKQIWAQHMAIARQERALKNRALRFALDEVSQNLSRELEADTFNWGLVQGRVVGTRQTFQLGTHDTAYFASRQVQALTRASCPPTVDRDQIVGQLTQALTGKLPRVLVKADIANFYESVPHGHLSDLVDRSQLFSQITRDLIRLLCHEYALLTGSKVGLPQGVGMSAALADLYLASIDRAAKTAPGVLFYARYVDDMVIVTADPTAAQSQREALESNLVALGLALNPQKTEVIDYSGAPYAAGPSFEFLGYQITKRNGALSTKIRHTNVTRIKQRIELSFKKWDTITQPNTGADGDLLNRIRYLSGNQQLMNSKSRAMIGTYFSYRALTQLADYQALDAYVKHMCDSRVVPSKLRARILALSFESGSRERRFNRFSQVQLSKIVSAWKT